MTAKSGRGAAHERVAQYHEEQFGELIRHVRVAVDGFRTGELDAFEVDEVIYRYTRAARELWKFCNYGDIEISARMVREEPLGDWWERGARRGR